MTSKPLRIQVQKYRFIGLIDFLPNSLVLFWNNGYLAFDKIQRRHKNSIPVFILRLKPGHRGESGYKQLSQWNSNIKICGNALFKHLPGLALYNKYSFVNFSCLEVMNDLIKLDEDTVRTVWIKK